MAENDEDRGATTTTQSPVDHEGWTGPVAAGVQIGGEYSEGNDAHVPNPTDMYRQYKTSGTGAHEDVSAVSPIFDADRQTLAVEAARALDPDDPGVPRSRVILPDEKGNNEQAIKDIQRRAEAAVENPVVIGGPSKAEANAAVSGPRGEQIAIREEVENPSRAVAANTTRSRHDTSTTTYPTADTSKSVTTPSNEGESGEGTPQEQHEAATKAAQQESGGGRSAAKKTAAHKPEGDKKDDKDDTKS